MRWAIVVEGLDPQWPFGSPDGVGFLDTVLVGARVDLHADNCASAARIASDRLMWFFAAAASRASSSSAVSRTATTCIVHWLAAHPRFHMHFTPTYSCQVERLFGYVTTDLLQRSDYRSVPALEADLRAWVKAWNDAPKPFI